MRIRLRNVCGLRSFFFLFRPATKEAEKKPNAEEARGGRMKSARDFPRGKTLAPLKQYYRALQTRGPFESFAILLVHLVQPPQTQTGNI